MGDQTIQFTPESPEIIAFATRMYDAARQGDMPIFEQALPAGLPPNMANDKGDSLVRFFLDIFNDLPSLLACFSFNLHHTPTSPLSRGTLLKLLIAHALDLSRSRFTFPSSPLSWC